MTEITREQLAEWERLANEATPGEWVIWRGYQFEGGGEDICIGRGDKWLANMDHRQPRCPQIFDDGHNMDECDICTIDAGKIDVEELANATFIAASRTAVPALIARIRELEAFVKAYDEWSNDESGLMGDTFDNMISAREAIKP